MFRFEFEFAFEFQIGQLQIEKVQVSFHEMGFRLEHDAYINERAIWSFYVIIHDISRVFLMIRGILSKFAPLHRQYKHSEGFSAKIFYPCDGLSETHSSSARRDDVDN